MVIHRNLYPGGFSALLSRGRAYGKGNQKYFIFKINLYTRAMPKRRRKQVVVNTAPKLPYPKVRVEWIDILSDSGWATDKEFDKMKLSYPVNEGWLYSKDKKSIKLFASFDRDEDGTITFGDRTMIPSSCVKKMTKLS
jgi:hypothetical protein